MRCFSGRTRGLPACASASVVRRFARRDGRSYPFGSSRGSVMQIRQLGGLWPVSALTLGGGGIGQVWGSTSRDEAVATVQAAVAGGVSLLDMAPGYGRGEAEAVVGEAFGGRLP